MIPIPMHGDDDLLDLPVGGRGKRDTPRARRQEGDDEWYGGGVPILPIGSETEQTHLIGTDSSDENGDMNEDDVSSMGSPKSTARMEAPGACVAPGNMLDRTLFCTKMTRGARCLCLSSRPRSRLQLQYEKSLRRKGQRSRH